MRRLLVVLFVLPVLYNTLAIPPALARAPIFYDIRVEINYEGGYLEAVEKLSYLNETGATLSSLVFQVPPAYFRAFTLSSSSVNDQPVQAARNGTVLELLLKRPLKPGEQAIAVLRFRLDLPPADGRFGFSDGIMALGDWYPMLSAYRSGWLSYQYMDLGDPFVSDVADYDVYVATSRPLVIAATGETVSQSSTRWHFKATRVRDFALALSPRYLTQSRVVEGVKITVFHQPETARGAAAALERAGEALRFYNARIAPYPYSNLNLAQTGYKEKRHPAQEHSGLVFLRGDVMEENGPWLDILVPHEIAHQWFYGLVGNDQVSDPWLDEGLVTFLSLDFIRERHPELYQPLWETWGDFRDNGFLNRPILAHPKKEEYFDHAYRQGATFLSELKDLMGPAAFYEGLRAYFEENRYRLARPQDLLRAMYLAAGRTEVLPLYRRYFDFPFLRNPKLTARAIFPAETTWVGTVTIPLRVEPANGRHQVLVYLDGKLFLEESGLTELELNTASLPEGRHVLRVVITDDGLYRVEQESAFTVLHPTPVPTPTATATPAPPFQALMSRSSTPGHQEGQAPVLWTALGVVGIAALLGIIAALASVRRG